jgi:hypothetical protein
MNRINDIDKIENLFHENDVGFNDHKNQYYAHKNRYLIRAIIDLTEN